MGARVECSGLKQESHAPSAVGANAHKTVDCGQVSAEAYPGSHRRLEQYGFRSLLLAKW